MMNLKKLTDQELKNLLANATRLDRPDVAADVLREMNERGIAQRSDYRALPWNQDAVKAALAPFFEVARSVKLNKRTPYTEAGGFKIGRSKNDPEHMWIDSYSGIKTDRLNAIFVCYVKRPGDDPEFQLQVDGVVEARFGADELPNALSRWKELALLAA